MKIAVASDHRGVRVKGQILAQIADMGFEALDFGPNEEKSVDYPDYAAKVGEAIANGSIDRGILICGTGMGMCITVNKFRGVRGVSCHDDVTAEMSRRHNNANVMCLSADMLGDKLLNRIVDIWMKTDFESGRHQRRLDKITAIEDAAGCGTTKATVERASCSGE